MGFDALHREREVYQEAVSRPTKTVEAELGFKTLILDLLKSRIENY
jgi:hypothetical protein